MAPSLRLLSIFLLFAFAVGTECASYDLGYEPQDLASEEALRSLFTRWTEAHRKFYNGLGENDERFSVFKDNVLYIHEYNEQHESHKLGLNEYADLTHDQFKEHRLGYSYDRVSNLLRMPRGSFSHGSVTEVPEEIDWREKGAVTPVKNQARCGKWKNLLWFLVFGFQGDLCESCKVILIILAGSALKTCD
jgi:xylem cysteine proteinase